MPDEPKKPITEEQIDWEEELPEWKDEAPKDYYEKMNAEQFAAMLEDNAAYAKYEAYKEAKARGEAPKSDYSGEETTLTPTVVDIRSWHGTQRPAREFLDDRRWFRMGMVSNFSGPGGIGKTMAVLQAGIACTSETQWLGRDIQAGPAMFYSAEEPIEEIHARIDEICEAEQLHLNEFPYPFEIIDMSWHPQAELIDAKQTSKGLVLSTTPMFHWLRARMLRVKPKVLFVDNRAQVVVGDENNRNVAGFAMRMFNVLGKDTGAAIVPLSHPSMSGSKTGASGSTQWFNTARSNVFMTRPGQEEDDGDLANLEGDDGKRVLRNNKSNYAPLNTEANVIWEMNRWRCTDKPVSADTMLGRAALHAKCERVFMELMKWHADQGIDLSHNPRAGNYAPRQFDKQPKEKREGFNETWFHKAMLSLLDQKKIKLLERRKNHHPSKFLVIA